MVLNRKVTGTASAMPVGLAMGLAASLGITLVGSAILAWLVGSEKLGQGSIGYGSLVILLLASVLGAVTAFGKIRHRRMLVCVLSGVLYYGSLLCVTALFFGGQYQGMGVTALVVLGGCLCVALLGLGGGRRKKYGKR